MQQLVSQPAKLSQRRSTSCSSRQPQPLQSGSRFGGGPAQRLIACGGASVPFAAAAAFKRSGGGAVARAPLSCVFK